MITWIDIYFFALQSCDGEVALSDAAISTQESEVRKWLDGYEQEYLPLCLEATNAAWEQASNITAYNSMKNVSDISHWLPNGMQNEFSLGVFYIKQHSNFVKALKQEQLQVVSYINGRPQSKYFRKDILYLMLIQKSNAVKLSININSGSLCMPLPIANVSVWLRLGILSSCTFPACFMECQST